LDCPRCGDAPGHARPEFIEKLCSPVSFGSRRERCRHPSRPSRTATCASSPVNLDLTACLQQGDDFPLELDCAALLALAEPTNGVRLGGGAAAGQIAQVGQRVASLPAGHALVGDVDAAQRQDPTSVLVISITVPLEYMTVTDLPNRLPS
jgi:hypothetical protein